METKRCNSESRSLEEWFPFGTLLSHTHTSIHSVSVSRLRFIFLQPTPQKPLLLRESLMDT